MQSVQTVVYERYGIAVLHADSVELPVVNTKSERIVLLAYEHDVARPWTRCWFSNAVSLHFLYLLVDNVQNGCLLRACLMG